jgi:hypothetical protein
MVLVYGMIFVVGRRARMMAKVGAQAVLARGS